MRPAVESRQTMFELCDETMIIVARAIGILPKDVFARVSNSEATKQMHASHLMDISVIPERQHIRI